MVAMPDMRWFGACGGQWGSRMPHLIAMTWGVYIEASPFSVLYPPCTPSLAKRNPMFGVPLEQWYPRLTVPARAVDFAMPRAGSDAASFACRGSMHVARRVPLGLTRRKHCYLEARDELSSQLAQLRCSVMSDRGRAHKVMLLASQLACMRGPE